MPGLGIATPLLAAAIMVIFFFGLWHLAATASSSTYTPPTAAAASSSSSPSTTPTLSNKRIILLIAHPDDESMFFAPTVQALTAPSRHNHVKILCLSTGNADGLGDVRRQELEAAALTLGVRRRQDVFVLDDESRFRDGMREQWSPDEVARVLASAFAPHLLEENTSSTTAVLPSGAAPKSRKAIKSAAAASVSASTTTTTTSPTAAATTTPAIDVLITFDAAGISSHPNHIALYHGARQFVSNLTRGVQTATSTSPVSLYTLTTVNIARKYSSIFDSIATFISLYYPSSSSSSSSSSSPSSPSDSNPQQHQHQQQQQHTQKAVFVSDIRQYLKAREAMVHGHKSQMVWFRWGWITLGRYMLINDLVREPI